MKTFLTRSKSSFLILVAVMALPLWARPVAQVTEVTGQVFSVTPEGKTVTLKRHDYLDEKSEVMVEEGGAVTLNDYYDASYSLIGGTHLKVFNKSVQLKRGKAWIQAKNEKHQLALTTANGHVSFNKGEFIATFDQATSRSQILVVNETVEVSNILDKNTKYSVGSGSFTMVDPQVENGIPRAPTKVGLVSLDNSLAEFRRVPNDMKEETTPSRSIASETPAPEKVAAKKGEIIFVSTNRLPASVSGGAHDYYKKTSKKDASKMTAVPIKFYGIVPKMVPDAVAPRMPASVPIQVNVPQKPAQKLEMNHEFDESLKKQMEVQPKHSKELNSLIDDLKSY